MGCLEPSKVPMPIPAPTWIWESMPPLCPGQNSQPGPRSLAGHSSPPAIRGPATVLAALGLTLSPRCPHPHFWPELDRGNSSWQTPKAGMREIHKPDVLLRGRGVGDGERKEEKPPGPWPAADPSGPGDWAHVS